MTFFSTVSAFISLKPYSGVRTNPFPSIFHFFFFLQRAMNFSTTAKQTLDPELIWKKKNQPHDMIPSFRLLHHHCISISSFWLKKRKENLRRDLQERKGNREGKGTTSKFGLYYTNVIKFV